MLCPKCNSKTGVVDTRSDEKGIYRRRRCKDCGNDFFTKEVLDSGFRMKQIESERSSRRYYEKTRLKA